MANFGQSAKGGPFLSLPIFFCMAPLPFVVVIFSDSNPPSKKRNLKISTFLIFSYLTLLCSLWIQYLQSLYYRELFIKKHKSKEREFRSELPVSYSYGSPWACDIWPVIGIFLVWIDEYKNDVTQLSHLLPWVVEIAVILIIVTFIPFTAVSAYSVVTLCPGISQCSTWLASS